MFAGLAHYAVVLFMMACLMVQYNAYISAISGTISPEFRDRFTISPSVLAAIMDGSALSVSCVLGGGFLIAFVQTASSYSTTASTSLNTALLSDLSHDATMHGQHANEASLECVRSEELNQQQIADCAALAPGTVCNCSNTITSSGATEAQLEAPSASQLSAAPAPASQRSLHHG